MNEIYLLDVLNKTAQGPYPAEQIREMLANESINLTQPAANNVRGPWSPLGQWPEFAPAFGNAARPPAGLPLPPQPIKHPSLAQTPVSLATVTNSGGSARYAEAYTTANIIVGLGKTVKIGGLISAGIIALIGIFCALNKTPVLVALLSAAVLVALLTWLAAILIAAYGQLIRATADTASNTAKMVALLSR